jgi:hypothetical protein
MAGHRKNDQKIIYYRGEELNICNINNNIISYINKSINEVQRMWTIRIRKSFMNYKQFDKTGHWGL